MRTSIYIALASALFTQLSLGAAPTIQDVCGPEGSMTGNSQLTLSCQGAYSNGNQYLVDKNNTYVYGTIAVVCAYSCLSGASNSCGASGSSCSGAAQNGSNAISDNYSSNQSYNDAGKSGANAFYLASNSGALNAGAAANSTPGASTLPAACASASSTGSVSDRIACAAATDPNLPSFVQTAQFQADFQQITGQSLQSVMASSGPQIMNGMVSGALQNAYKQLSSKMSLTDFMSTGMNMLTAMTSHSKDPGVQKTLLSMLSQPAEEKADAPAATALASQPKLPPNLPKDSNLEKMLPSLNQTAQRDLASLDLGENPEMNPKVSLFDRVSQRYQQSDIFNEEHTLAQWKMNR